MSEAIGTYLCWAKANRKENWLIAPEGWDGFAWSALHHLCGRLPPNLNRVQGDEGREPEGDMVVEAIHLERSLKFGSPRLSPNSGLESFQPSMAALPVAWYTPLAAVEHQLKKMLGELARSGTVDKDQLSQATVCLPTYLCGRRVFFQTECLHRVVLRTMAKLGSTLSAASESRMDCAKEFYALINRHSLGRHLLERCIRQMLLRGFADGVRVVLGRRLPSLYASARWKPVVRYPWLLLNLPAGHVPSAQINWTLQRGTD